MLQSFDWLDNSVAFLKLKEALALLSGTNEAVVSVGVGRSAQYYPDVHRAEGCVQHTAHLCGTTLTSFSICPQVVVQLTDDLLSQAVMMVENSRPTLAINLSGARQYWLEGMLRHEIGQKTGSRMGLGTSKQTGTNLEIKFLPLKRNKNRASY